MCKYLHAFSNLGVVPACIFHFVDDLRAERSAGGRVSASKEDDRTEEIGSVKIIVPVCLLGEQ